MRAALSKVRENHHDVVGQAYVGPNTKVKLRMVGE